MCPKCHSSFDFTDSHKKALNKGRKGVKETPEQKAKRTESLKNAWATGKRKQPAHGKDGRFDKANVG
jgi:hypothetical protein